MGIQIRNGSLITGNGTTVHKRAHVRVGGNKITDIVTGDIPGGDNAAEEIIDATGCTIIPGIINAHAHGCIHGPSMPSGSRPMAEQDVEYYRNRHLLQGTTTLLNVCGLAFPDEIEVVDGARHSMDIHVSTAHTDSNIQAAISVDGTGLSQRHVSASIDQLLAQGAKALGEVGGGQTLGGGAQEYRFIPAAFKREFGVEIEPSIARRLKNAVLGRYLDERDGVPDADLDREIAACGLAGRTTADHMRAIIIHSVMPSVSLALTGFEEVAIESARVGYPAIFHNAAPTAKRLIELAEKYPKAQIVAGHSNHPMFLSEEAVSVAETLRARGAIIDVSTLDCIATRWRNDAANFDALIEVGCVDTISTDFAGGHWDGILEAIHRIIRKGQMPAPSAVALATGNVARAFPQLAGDRGLVDRGKRADLLIVDSANFSRVRYVVIEGRIVVRNGRPV
jgi:predicted amidohydrolase